MKNKKGIGFLLTVAFLLPVILYVVYFWRSGVFTDVSDLSSMFASGSFSQERTLVSPTVDLPTRTLNGVTYTYDATTTTWQLSGLCTKSQSISMGRVTIQDAPGYLFLDFDYSPELTGSFYTYFSNVVVTDQKLTYYPTRGRMIFYQVAVGSTFNFNFQMYEGVDYTGMFFKLNSSFVVQADDFSGFQVVNHTPGSFGEFLSNNFSVHELNCIVSEPAIHAIGAIGGEISPASAYNIYVVSAYTVYIILIWIVLLIVKIITFVPCAITKFIDKLGGS